MRAKFSHQIFFSASHNNITITIIVTLFFFCGCEVREKYGKKGVKAHIAYSLSPLSSAAVKISARKFTRHYCTNKTQRMDARMMRSHKHDTLWRGLCLIYAIINIIVFLRFLSPPPSLNLDWTGMRLIYRSAFIIIVSRSHRYVN